AAAKLDKLRYMDALQSGSTGDADYENTLQGRVWRGADPAPDNHVLGAGPQDCAAPDLTGNAEPERVMENSYTDCSTRV
ncbi:jg6405, partial [Pararge aegeria aegeria]